MTNRCRRCGREIPQGVLFYHVKLMAVSGYDGIIDPDHEADVSAIIEEISERTPEELEKDVYFEQEAILCGPCRTAVVETFCGQLEIDGSHGKNRADLLH